MKWRFISVGKPSLQYAKGGVEEYLKRLRRYVSVEHVSVKNGPREEEQVRLLAASEFIDLVTGHLAHGRRRRTTDREHAGQADDTKEHETN